jgi:putative SOS response-associated peptidase YedK
MCGRYGRRADKQRIAEWMQTHDTNVFDDSYLAPSYNVAPQTMQPVVRLDNETGHRELTIMRWGLIPFWSKDAKIGYSTINAKSRDCHHQPRIPRGDEAPSMPGACRMALRVEEN